jgi:hypothetical protein
MKIEITGELIPNSVQLVCVVMVVFFQKWGMKREGNSNLVVSVQLVCACSVCGD